jgi:uncharacterized protein YjbI with pentapeptide repeats
MSRVPQRPREAPDSPTRRYLVIAVVLLFGAVVTIAPAWWLQAARTVARTAQRHGVSVVLGVAGGAVLFWWYRTWRAGVRPARPIPVARRWPLFGHVSVLLSAGVVAAAVIGALLWWALGSPTLQLTAPPPTPGGARPAGWSVQNTFDAIKIVLSLVAGIGAVVALAVAYRKQDLSEAAEHREEAKEAREDTKLFNERFTKASDQLGSDQAAVRLAGVYAMAGLADDWAAGRQTCIEVLCAYLRMPYTPPADDTAAPVATLAQRVLRRAAPVPGDDADVQAERRQEREVRNTVLDVIGEHLRPAGQGSRPRWQGHRFNFRGAVIDGGDLSRITTSGDTELTFNEATFVGTKVSFEEATFVGGMVSFREATFSAGEVSFFNATFSGGAVNFAGAVFSGGDVDFSSATFTDGDVFFGGATFGAGVVSFSHATFSGGVVFFGAATFSGGEVPLNSATFAGGHLLFSGAVFSGGLVDFSGADLFDGLIGFFQASFCGSRMPFSSEYHGDATFAGCVVDVTEPKVWQTPPTGIDASLTGVRWPSPGLLVVAAPPPRKPGRYRSALRIR